MIKQFSWKKIVGLLAVLVLAVFTGQIVFNGETVIAKEKPKYKKVTLVLNCATGRGTDSYAWGKKIAELTKKYTDGRVRVKVFARGEVYKTYHDISKALFSGGSDMMINVHSSFVTAGVKKYGIFAVPGLLVPSPEEKFFGERVNRFWKDPKGGGVLRRECEAKGVKLIGDIAETFPVVLFFKKALMKDEVKGLKLRVAASKGYRLVMEHLGIVAVPVPYADTYTGLQQGLIDGAVTGTQYYNSGKWYEVCPYVMEMPINTITLTLAANLKKWNSLSEQLRDLLENVVAPEAHQYVTELIDSKMMTMKSELEGKGVTFYRWPDEEIKALDSWYPQCWNQFRTDYGDALVDTAIRARNLR